MTRGTRHLSAAADTVAAEIAALEARVDMLTTENRALRAALDAVDNTDPAALSLRLPAAARALGVSESTVKRLVARGELHTVKIGHSTAITADELRRYLRPILTT